MNDRFEAMHGAVAGQKAAEVDAGLRSHMLRVYNYMSSGVLLTGIVALFTASSPALQAIVFQPGLSLVIMLAPLAFVLVMSFGINKMSPAALQTTFWLFAGVMGLSLSSILLVYTGESVARTFFVTAATFASLSLYGYTTKKNLSGMGTFLFMGLVGLIIASVVNMFMQSSMMSLIISAGGVLIFAGLTAYDTQRIREQYFQATDGVSRSKMAIMGALNLYLDFINLFLYLLRFLGDRR
ncbi:MAG: Bax inhibitor-1/YccA family protein [Sphingomonadales bacterium]|nr:Bax inhibitor-1/YccA family protein [Sphingomonadales bacterium]